MHKRTCMVSADSTFVTPAEAGVQTEKMRALCLDPDVQEHECHERRTRRSGRPAPG